MLEKKIEITREINSSSLSKDEELNLTNFHLFSENEKEKIFLPSEEIKSEIDVYDVASYILVRFGRMSSMKLQKLVYYCQAWSLVWDEKPLFSERIKAWANGPVVGELFFQLKGLFQVDEDDLLIGNYRKLNYNQMTTIDAVLKHYGDKSAQWLIELTHNEEPWKKARIGLLENERSDRIIDLDSIAEYYCSLLDD